MSADVDLDHVTIRFGEFVAVKSVSMKIAGGEFFSILGPSGCGKTTLLRTISGFLEPTEGAVRIGGKDMAGIGSNKRPTALIFQNLALFPLMSVADNIGYGLRVRGVPAERAAQGRRTAAPRRAAGHGRQADQRTLGRPEAARRDRARARRRAAGAAARRAAVGARPAPAPAHAHRVARDPEARRHHLHLHHPRPGRGADHVGPHRGDERRARRAGRRRARRSTTIRRRRSSPRSLARTTASTARRRRSTTEWPTLDTPSAPRRAGPAADSRSASRRPCSSGRKACGSPPRARADSWPKCRRRVRRPHDACGAGRRRRPQVHHVARPPSRRQRARTGARIGVDFATEDAIALAGSAP